MSNSYLSVAYSLLLVATLLTGCAQLQPLGSASVEPGQNAVTATETSVAGKASRLVAIDLVNALVQVKGMHPQQANLQMNRPVEAFGQDLFEVLNAAGYGISLVESTQSANLVDFKVSINAGTVNMPAGGVSRTFQMNVGDVKIKRDYLFTREKVAPQSHLFVRGADTSTIKLNDAIFEPEVDSTFNPSDKRQPASDIVADTVTVAKADTVAKTHTVEKTDAITNTEAVAKTHAIANTDTSAPSPSSSLILKMQIRQNSNSTVFKVGDPILLFVEPTRDAQVYCYYQDGLGKIALVFPNRFARDNSLAAGEVLRLPDSEHWQLKATRAGETDQFMCIAANPELASRLKEMHSVPDLQPLSARNLQQIYRRYELAAGEELSTQRISVAVDL